MNLIEKYKSIGIETEEQAFSYFIDNLKDTIRTYDFFVAWGKVITNVSKIEIPLNIMNSLIGSVNISAELRELIKSYPEVVPVIPILIAVREKTIKIANIDGDIEYVFTAKKNYAEAEIDRIVYFCERCGLLRIFADRNVKNLVDYCIGVEAGLDTNARKNRSGSVMENLIETHVKTICGKHHYRYIPQATAAKIKEQFGRTVPTDKSDRHYDFAINADEKIYLLEVNYYSGGGSKLKSVAGEFRSLFNIIKKESDVGFIWVTDGKGWNTAKHPLRETYNDTDYIMNIKMIQDGFLEEVITKSL